MRTVLFVCTGNTCRSSMAAAIAGEILRQKGDEQALRILSAGTSAYPGAPASKQAIEAMGEEGIDLSAHRATPLTEELIREADLILAMTQSHKDQILSLVPDAAGKVFLLKEFSRNPEEVRCTLERQQELRRAVQEKQADFFRRHGAAIETLHDEKERIRRRLKEIDAELLRMENQLLEELQEEREALEDLEEQMASLEVMDPYGQPVDAYKRCAAELKEAIGIALDKILAKKTSS